MLKWQKYPHIRLIAVVLSGMIAFSSLFTIPAKRADAATIYIKNTARATFTDNLSSYYLPVSDTAVLTVYNIPIFRSLLKIDDQFSPNGDSRVDTSYISYELYDHDNPQDTVSLCIYNGPTVVRKLLDNISQNTGTYTVPWNGRNDTGALLADGIYAFLLSALNTDGNTTTASGTITFDITPPSGTVYINGNSEYCNTYSVFVDLAGYDNLTGVNTVVISNTPDFSVANTVPYDIDRRSWTLTSDTSPIKTVYVKYIDRVWNVSPVYSDTIVIDLIPPSVTLTTPANGETGVPETATITAVFDDTMNTSTLNNSTFLLKDMGGKFVNGTVSSQVYINTTAITFAPKYLRSAETYTATITTGAKDKSGNAIANDKVWKFQIFRYDTTPPTGTILINNNALYTNTTTVTLNLKAYDEQSPVSNMYVSNSDLNNALKLAYTETTAWTLSAQEGVKKVTVWLEDDALNLSTAYSDTITLDLTPPQVLWTTPCESEVKVHIDAKVKIAFSDTLDTNTLDTSTIILQNSLGSTVPGVITYEVLGNTSVVTFAPVSNLATNETYIVIITTGVKDKSGLALSTSKVWWFRTGDFMPPSVIEVIRAIPLSSTQVRLNWRLVTRNMDGTPCTDIDKYVILRSMVSGGPYTEFANVSASETTYIDTTVIAGNLCYYIVRAQDTNGNSGPYLSEVNSKGDVVIRILRANGHGNAEIQFKLGQKTVATASQLEDYITNVFIPTEAASVLYQNSNVFGDDLGIYILRNFSEESAKTRNLGTIVTCYEINPYKVTNQELIPELKFPKNITITMRYEVENGFIKYTSIPAAFADKNLSISYWNGIQWVRLGGVVDASKQTVSVVADHLSKFAITALNISTFTVLSAEPNPFTPHNPPFDKVVFSFVNPDNEEVTLRIFDLTGTLVYAQSCGIGSINAEWKGVDVDGAVTEDGAYVYQIQVGKKFYTGTVILAK